MSGEWHGGKGSGRRRMEISQQEWDTRWDAIFQRDQKDNTGTNKNEYYDVLSTEDCFRNNEETQQVIKTENKNGLGSA